MATKHKVKRFVEGGDTEFGDLEGAMDAANARAVQAQFDENEKPSVAAKASSKSPMVTKEQLAKSGLSLRDYMNKQQGLTRRGAAKDEMASVAKDRASAYKEAEAAARTPEARAERQKQIEGQAVERVAPETYFMPGASIKTIAGLAKGLANRHAAQGVEKLAEYSTPILEGGRKMLAGPMKQLGMKKGGAVNSAPKASSASRRADGIATKGKTRGRYL